MSFLTNLFAKKKSESVMLIDIGAESVAGAYLYYKENQKPNLLYTYRLPIENRKEELNEMAMFRALKMLCDIAIKEGSPMLLRSTGSGRIDNILVSIDSPWQETSVRTEHFKKRDTFVFTRSMVDNVLKQIEAVSDKKVITDQSIIGTILNGYETHRPYGKRVHRASVIVLTSHIEKRVADGIITVVRSSYHTKNITPIADSSMKYQAMCHAFPHDRDMLILDAIGPITTISLVRKGLFVRIVEVSVPTGSSALVDGVMTEFSKLAEKYPLPRAIFLLAQGHDAVPLQKRLSKAKLEELWLTDNPPTIVSVLSSTIATSINQTTTASLDLPLLLMALYYQHRFSW